MPIDVALALLTLGLLLIYVEMNRPGAILPGALGLVGVLFALFAIAHSHPPGIAGLWLAVGTAILAVGLLGLLERWLLLLAIIAAILLAMGFLCLGRNAAHPLVHLVTGTSCALLLSLSTTYLARIARRARRNKRMTAHRLPGGKGLD